MKENIKNKAKKLVYSAPVIICFSLYTSKKIAPPMMIVVPHAMF